MSKPTIVEETTVALTRSFEEHRGTLARVTIGVDVVDRTLTSIVRDGRVLMTSGRATGS